MAANYGQHVSTRVTPQQEPVPGRTDQIPNSEGGYVFAVDDWMRLERFAILGSEGGSFYAGEHKLTVENAEAVLRCLKADPQRTIDTVVAISEGGRAPKNDAAIFVLALAAGHGEIKRVIPVLSRVCRVGTHVFQFVEAVQHLRGWGPDLRRAVAGWYTTKSAGQLAYQVAKYAQRQGWAHRDVLRLAHPKTDDPAVQAVLRWASLNRGSDTTVAEGLADREVIKPHGPKSLGRTRPLTTHTYGTVAAHLPAFLAAVDEAKTADEATTIRLIREHNLPRECVRTEHLNMTAVWEALLEKMPPTAMLRNLNKMTALGLLAPLSNATKHVCEVLTDETRLKKARLHPLTILMGARTYAGGQGLKGNLTWDPVAQVNDALDAAFYLAFGNVVPANKRTLLALDVSGSMSGSMSSDIAGTRLSCREATAALALVIAKTEPAYHVMGFSHRFMPLDITKTDRLTDALRKISGLPFEGTDCSKPMTWALEKKVDVDVFHVYTDSETWAGPVHPYQALRVYREQMGIPAKSIVCGMVANNFTIADPNDAGMLDVVGMDTATPNVMTDFARGAPAVVEVTTDEEGVASE